MLLTGCINFLSHEQIDYINQLGELFTMAYKDGSKSKKGKSWYIGLNTCKLLSVGFGYARNGNMFLTATFKRENEFVYWLKGIVRFVPHTEYFFDYNRLRDLCKCFGHELKEKPVDMPNNTYLSHVKARLDTFIGKQLKVVCSVSYELRKDNYGFEESRNFKTHDPIYDPRMKLLFTDKVDWKHLYEELTKHVEKHD